MLHSVKNMQGFALHASDGEIGSVQEFYFDDDKWAVRFIVVDTGSWLSGRQVLISPYAVERVNWKDNRIDVRLTKQQVENSPDIDTHKPIDRQREEEYYSYYGYPYYWTGPLMWGPMAYPAYMPANSPQTNTEIAEIEEAIAKRNSEDCNLRSTKVVTGYYIEASDGDIGHVEDFILDDETWAIRYVAVDTRNWLPGKKVLIAPRWIDRVSWEDSKVYVSLSRESIESAPEYHPDALNREYEEKLHNHYDRPKYWDSTLL